MDKNSAINSAELRRKTAHLQINTNDLFDDMGLNILRITLRQFVLVVSRAHIGKR